MTIKEFSKTIWRHYGKHRRSFPWRENTSPYHIVVSEIMLQQTQAPRVVPKFNSFIKRFPDFKTLAGAPLREVLAEWQGLGYNRRALQLKKLAETVVTGSGLPRTKEALAELPGIGPNTAGSILAFAYDIPQAFIETNIRTVFIHFFFKNTRRKVHDKEILALVGQALAGKNNRNARNPREWYYALMDYGVYLKSAFPNPSRKSLHHVRQSPFKGSNRELRAKILRSIVEKPRSARQIFKLHEKSGKVKTGDAIAGLIAKNLSALEKEGLIVQKNRTFRVTD